MNIVYRRAKMTDLAGIVEFVDYWLAGRGIAEHAKGAVNDYFITHKQHFDYLRRYAVLLALDDDKIIGWSVLNDNRVLITLLVAGTHRGHGIGREMLCRLNPDMVRSKVDQSTGDPAEFYKRCGFVPAGFVRVGKKKNIELFIRSDVDVSCRQ